MSNSRNSIPSNEEVGQMLFEDTDAPMQMFGNKGILFFKPDMDFIKWIAAYANGRLILEIGSGTAHVLHLLHHSGYNKVMGIEPSWDPVASAMGAMKADSEILHVMPWTVTKAGKMIRDITTPKEGSAFPGALILACRPCHGSFVAEAIDHSAPGTEIMYITKRENLRLYNDLGEYSQFANTIPHQGTSTDKEVVQVLVKP